MALNSRRVTRTILRSVAAGLGLPTTASVEELRQIIDGQLTERGRGPRDVLVEVERRPSGTEGSGCVRLHDGEGMFLEVDLLTTEPVETSGEDAHAPVVGSRDRTPDREATLVAERDRLVAEMERYRTELEAAHVELEKSVKEADAAKKRLKEVWRMNCEQSIMYDEELAAKDDEIAELHKKLAVAPHSDHTEGHERTHHAPPATSLTTGPRRGKAPPVDSFSGEDGAIRLDDWLPSLERAASWNAWTDEEKVMQLAGHLRG